MLTTSSPTTIRLSFSWLLVLLLAMLIFGVIGGLLAQRLLPTPLPLPEDGQQLVTTVQQVTVSPSKQRTAVAQQLGKSVVTVIQQTAGAAKLLGLGTIVTNDGYIVTPESVLVPARGGEGTSFAVIDSSGAVAAVQVIGTDAVYGLTYLKLSSGVGVPIELVADEALPGTALVSVSRSLATGAPTVGSFELQEYVVPPQDPAATGGLVAVAWQRLARGQYSAASLTGAPLANEEGKVVGLTLNAEHGLALRAVDLKESLDRVTSGRRELDPLATIGIAVDYDFAKPTGPPAGVPQFTVTVTAVTAASPAAVAGVRSQDVIVRVGMESVSWQKNLVGMLGASLPVELTLSRQGEERTVTVSSKPEITP